MPNFAALKTSVGRGVLRDDLSSSYGDYINQALREIQNRHSFVSMKDTTFVTVRPGVLGAGGNVVPPNSVWSSLANPANPANQIFVISGLALGSRYYFNPGNASGISADGVNPINAVNGFFTATQVSYTLLAPNNVAGQIITAAVISAGIDQVAILPANFKELQRTSAIHYVSDDGQFIPAEVVFEWQQYFRIWAFGGTPLSTWPPRIYFERRSQTQAVIGVVEPLTEAFNFKVKYYGYLPDLSADADTSPIAEAYPRMVIAKAKAIAFSDINDPSEAQFETEFEEKFQAALRQDAYSEVVGRTLHM